MGEGLADGDGTWPAATATATTTTTHEHESSCGKGCTETLYDDDTTYSAHAGAVGGPDCEPLAHHLEHRDRQARARVVARVAAAPHARPMSSGASTTPTTTALRSPASRT